MGKLGGFGSLSFVVSSNTIRTFEKLQWDVGASYATHDRHMMPDLLEFLGPDLETISLPVKFSVFLGTNPILEVERLRAMIRSGAVERLVLGGHVYGDYKWAITKMSAELKTFDNRGNCWAANTTLDPQTVEEEVLINGAIILDSYLKSVTLIRGLGMNTDRLHRPVNVVANEIVANIHDQFEQYEPRAILGEITVDASNVQGMMDITVEIVGVKKG